MSARTAAIRKIALYQVISVGIFAAAMALCAQLANAQQGRTVGDMLRKIEKKGAQTIELKKGAANLPQAQGIKKLPPPPSKEALRSIKPPSSSSLLYSKDQNQRELEKVTDAGIKQLFKLTQRFRTSSRRGELWLRLAELYVEKARLIEFRLNEDHDKKMAAFDAKKLARRPVLSLKPAQEYNKKAIQLYEWFLRDFPKDPKIDQTLFFLGFNYIELGQLQKGLGFYDRLVKEYPRSIFIEEAHFALGEYYFDNEKYPDAVKSYGTVARNEKGRLFSFALYKTAWSQYKAGQVVPALRSLENVIMAGRRMKSAEGTSDEGAGRIRLATEALKDLVAFYAEAGSPDKANDYFTRVAGEKAADKMVEKLAYYYVDTGNRTGARQLFGDLIERQPMAPKAYDYQYQIVTFYASGGDEKTFREELFNWIERYGPESAWARANVKNVELTKKSQELIESTLRNFVLQSHQTAQNAKTENSRKQAQQGYELYLQSFKSTPQMDEMRFFYAELLYDMKLYEKAGEQYSWVVFNAPKSKYFEKSNLNAILSMEKKLPTPEEIKTLVGDSNQPIEFDANVKQFESVATKYFTSFPKGDNAFEIKYRLASLYYYYNQFENAIKLFREVIQANPKSQSAEFSANLILDIYNIKKDLDGLQAAADDLLKVPGLANNAKLRDQIRQIKERTAFKQAQNLESGSDFVKAAAGFEDFAVKNPASPLAMGAFFNAAVNYEKGNKPAKAIAMYTKVLQSRSSEKNAAELKKKSLLFLPTLYERSGQYRKASDAFEAYIKENPKDPQSTDFYFNVAVIQDGLNLWDSAIKNYENYLAKSRKRDRFEVNALIARIWERRRNVNYATTYYERHVNGPADNPRGIIESAYRIAKLQEGRNSSKAQDWHKRVIRLQKALSKGQKELGASFAAESQFYLIYPQYTEFRNVRIPANPANQQKAVQTKLGMMNRLKDELKKVVAYDDGPMVTAALALQGSALQHLAFSIQSVPAPSGLKPDELKEYRAAVEKLYKPFEDQAVDSYKTALAKGRELQGYNNWLKTAVLELSKLRPAEYKNLNYTTIPMTLVDPLKGFSNRDYKRLYEADSENVLVQYAAEILSEDPKDVGALNAMANFYIEKRNYGMARIILARAIKEKPEVPGLHNNVGVTWMREGEQRKGMAAYLDGLRQKPDHFYCSANLASVQVEHYDYNGAIEPLREAFRQLSENLSGDNAEGVAVGNNYAVALAGLDKGDDADSVFSSMMEKEVRQPVLLLNYATLLTDTLNKKEKAAKIVTRLKFVSEDPETLKRARELEKKIQQ